MFCDAYGDGSECATGISHGPVVGPAFLWVVASNINGWVGDGGTGNGVGALQFGVTYSGLTVDAWFRCTGPNGAEIPQNEPGFVWPGSGTGNAVAWDGGCYDPLGENAKIGLFLLNAGASTGSMQVTVDPRAGAGIAAYTDCDAFTWQILGLNGIDFDAGSTPGCGPIVPTEEKSWSQIKSMF
jgi:hypothetical protein